MNKLFKHSIFKGAVFERHALGFILLLSISFYVQTTWAGDDTASTSSQLKVSSGFNFATHRTVLFDIQVSLNNSDNRAPFKVVISSIDGAVTDVDDPLTRKKDILFIARPDNQGVVYRQVSVPDFVDKILVETQINGKMVLQLVELADKETVYLVLN